MEFPSHVDGCPETFSLYWLNQRLDEDAVFAEQAAIVLQQRNERRPKVLQDTTTRASAASALVNEWLVNRDLPCYRRGRPIDDFAAEIVEPIYRSISEAMDILEDSIDLYRDDVVRLLQQTGMTVPPYLQTEAPDVPTTPRRADDERGRAAAPPEASQPSAYQTAGEGNQSVLLSIGANSKDSVDAYIEKRARAIHAAGEATTMQCIAQIIANEMESKGYRGERNNYLQWATVVKSIPSGLTGGRGRNGRQPKQD
ncbi:hypothetical protein AB9X41_23520 [Ralstonia solanacearum]|uniref:hypothetical protein n=1 Tax=Ralstonia solanacearum TaxID=305 RepID=UPI0035194429